ncbi:unnamed protein product [Soboliphyme baturini]|uniref:NR LBD domain-containing protein n=1 Tax=Soboliphyme baturini TaxID=241478 RepID=A0A183IN67_9BILA|nr:unnamed protein product [Soboliphyme baturini]
MVAWSKPTAETSFLQLTCLLGDEPVFMVDVRSSLLARVVEHLTKARRIKSRAVGRKLCHYNFTNRQKRQHLHSPSVEFRYIYGPFAVSTEDACKRQSSDIFSDIRRRTRFEWWVDCANKLTFAVQQIIEFAKLIPGFMKLQQDDQIMLLKGGAFEVALIRMSSLYDFTNDSILYGGVYVPVQFFVSEDQMEQRFIHNIFSLVRELSSYCLTEAEVALFSAVVLMSPGRSGIRNQSGIREMHELFFDCLITELRTNHAVDITLMPRLTSILSTLQELAAQHIVVLAKFKKLALVELPPLYKELFTIDG